MKKCFKCGCEKPLADFYKHKAMSDGHLNKCKECTKSDVKKNRDDNSEYYKEYDAWRFKNQPQVKERHKKYRNTESCRLSMSVSRKEWAARNPEKRAAHVILGNTVKGGRIQKPNICENCNQFTPSRKLHGHHHDYSMPLDVTWLCVDCHASVHSDR